MRNRLHSRSWARSTLEVDPHARMHLLALGLTLSAASIACDGFTSMFQERLYEQCPRQSEQQGGGLGLLV